MPSPAQLLTLFEYSLITNIGVYIGGSDALAYQRGKCPDQGLNVSASSLATDMDDGWSLGFFWVGYQNPGSPDGNTYTTSTATSDGETDAANAESKMCNLGLCGSSYGPIYADVEGFGATAGSTNLTAAELYVNGWSYELDKVKGVKSGVYGSLCDSAIDDYKLHSNVPDYIWPAWYSDPSHTTTTNLSSAGCPEGIPSIANNNWDHDQRIVQWSDSGSIKIGANGPTVGADFDCVLGGMTSVDDFQKACKGTQSSY